MPPTEIDTTNWGLVGTQGEYIIFIAPVPQKITKALAINMAAWLVALADNNNEFPALLEAVKNT